jgi:sRNA-binding regulator protein Hfq
MPGYLVRSAHPRARGYRGGSPGPRPVEAVPVAARWEASLFEGYRDQRVPLEIVCFDGILVHGYLRAWERYSLLVDTPEGEVLLMKHGIIRIGARPERVGASASAARRFVRGAVRRPEDRN